MERKNRINIGYLYALAAGISSGLVPVIFQKALGQSTLPRITGLFIKLVASSLVLLPLALPKIKQLRPDRKLYGKIGVCSLLYIATLIFLYESYEYIPTGISISLHYTFPFFTMLFSAVLFHFRCTKQSVAAMLLSLIGVALLSSGSVSDGGAPLGIVLALSSAVTYAGCFLWIEHKKLTELNTTVSVTLRTCGAALLSLPYVLLSDGLTCSMSFRTFFGVVLSGLFTVLASFFLTIAIRHIGSVHTSILGSIEPIVCAVGGVLVLGETVGLRSGIGIIMVLVATVLVTLSNQKAKNSRGGGSK